MSERICIVCGMPIPSTRRKNALTCSKACAYEKDAQRGQKYREAHREELRQKCKEYYNASKEKKAFPPPKCKKCGSEYRKTSSAQRYCPKCRQERVLKSFKPPKRNISLSKAVLIAQDHGLSYGQAVAAGII